MGNYSSLTLWQEMNSPHLLPLLDELVGQFETVRLVTLGEIDPVRESIGWNDRVPDSIEHVHAPDRSTRSAVLDTCLGLNDLHLLQGLKPAGWIRQVQGALIAARAPFMVLSELHWPGQGLLRALALDVRERVLTRFWSRHALGLLAFSEEAAAHYASHGFAPQRVHPFAYTPALSEARPSSPDAGPPVIAVAAKLEPYKGIDVLLRALPAIADQPWRLKVAGDGTMRRELEALARAGGIDGRIDWLGWQPADSIPQMFADAALVILPSRFEGWGAVVNEALGVGTPAVVSRGAGAHCLLRDPLLGESCPADDPAAMAEAIARQIASPASARRETIRAWARATIAPSVAANYFMACLGNEPTPAPWRAVPVERA